MQGQGDMKKGFTLLELVFVIVVIGILAAVVIPRTRTNPVQEGAIQLLADIRYTQHLALMDDKFDAADAGWYKNRWQIKFNGNTYSIVSDNGTRPAVNPSNVDTDIVVDLNHKYGVTVTIKGTECAGETMISFDHVGRPIVGDLDGADSSYGGTGVKLMKSDDCDIVLSNGDESATINIAPETGYAKVTF